MKFIVQTLALLVLLAVGVGFAVTVPKVEDGAALTTRAADPEAGRAVFLAGGCASCHAAPGSADKTVLAGGYRMDSPFGTFLAPNISPHPEAGIGGWDVAQFATALRQGVSPEGAHYYPAFPYASYARLSDQDVVDLFAYLRALPPDPTPSLAHEVGFPFSLRRGIGLWKARYMQPDWVLADAPTPELERGR